MPEDKPITLDEAAEFNKFKEWWFSIYPSTINPVLVYDHIEKYFKPQWQSQQKETKPTGLRKLIDIRNKFYHNLPTGDIKSWDLLQHIKSHLKDIDNYINQHTTTSEETEETKPVEEDEINSFYDNWIKKTKRNGGVLIGPSIKELLHDFIEWQRALNAIPDCPELPYALQWIEKTKSKEPTKPVEDKADIIAGIISEYENGKDYIPKGLNYADYQTEHTKLLQRIYDRNIQPTKPVSEEGEFNFNKWIIDELEYRKSLLQKSNDKANDQWYKAQIGMLEIVIKQIPEIKPQTTYNQ